MYISLGRHSRTIFAFVFREAQALKAQSQELQAAEELEREAAMRRERAVAHGEFISTEDR